MLIFLMILEYCKNICTIYEHWKNVPVWSLIVGAILPQFPLKGNVANMSKQIEAILLQQSVAKQQHSSSVHIYCTNILAILQNHEKNQHKNIIIKLIFLPC